VGKLNVWGLLQSPSAVQGWSPGGVAARVVNSWNMQSAQCVNAFTINTFKKYVLVV